MDPERIHSGDVKIAIFHVKNGDVPIKNGDVPIKNDDFPLKMGLSTFVAIEDDHRNNGFSHDKWWIFPQLSNKLPEESSMKIATWMLKSMKIM